MDQTQSTHTVHINLRGQHLVLGHCASEIEACELLDDEAYGLSDQSPHWTLAAEDEVPGTEAEIVAKAGGLVHRLVQESCWVDTATGDVAWIETA